MIEVDVLEDHGGGIPEEVKKRMFDIFLELLHNSKEAISGPGEVVIRSSIE